VVQWNPDLSFFIANSLSPAKVMNVMLQDRNGKTAVVVVPDKQLSLAIGKEGQNARLAAKLTGWRIDIKSASEAIAETIERVKVEEAIRERVSDKLEIYNMASAILADKNPVEYTDSELRIFGEAIESVNLADMAIARERKAAEEARVAAARQAAKDRDILAEAEAILSGQAPVAEEEKAGDALAEAVEAGLVEGKVVELEEEVSPPTEEEAVEPEAEVTEEVAEELPAEAEPEVEPEPEPVAEAAATPETAEEIMAEAEAVLAEEPEQEEPARVEPAEEYYDEFDEFDEMERERKKQEARKKKRRLVYDEKLGEVVAERRRKRSRRTDDWLDYTDEDEF
jgi:N utilization substance protein A